MFLLRDWVGADTDLLTQINNSEVPNVTLITPDDLIEFSKKASHFRVAESPSGEIAGFVLAMDETAVYASLNFQWFKSRYPKFSYVDRIVVAASSQGRGLGQLLYTDLQKAVESRSPFLSCEVNIRPPNAASMTFHQRFGFREVGVQETEGGKKTVALMIKPLTAEA